MADIDFIEESDSEDENSGSEDDGLPVNEGMLFSIVKLSLVLVKKCQNLS